MRFPWNWLSSLCQDRSKSTVHRVEKKYFPYRVMLRFESRNVLPVRHKETRGTSRVCKRRHGHLDAHKEVGVSFSSWSQPFYGLDNFLKGSFPCVVHVPVRALLPGCTRSPEACQWWTRAAFLSSPPRIYSTV